MKRPDIVAHVASEGAMTKQAAETADDFTAAFGASR